MQSKLQIWWYLLVVAVVPASSIQYVTVVPASSIQYVTVVPASSIQYVTVVPASSIQYVAVVPASSIQYVTVVPASSIQYVTVVPASSIQYVTVVPASSIQYVAVVPASSIQYVTVVPASSIQYVAVVPASSIVSEVGHNPSNLPALVKYPCGTWSLKLGEVIDDAHFLNVQAKTLKTCSKIHWINYTTRVCSSGIVCSCFACTVCYHKIAVQVIKSGYKIGKFLQVGIAEVACTCKLENNYVVLTQKMFEGGIIPLET